MNLEILLDGIRFPTAKVQIIDYAEDQGASQEAMNVLQAIPARDYNNIQEINAELGLVEEQQGSENQWSTNKAKPS